jgi:hypothetical protein
MASNTIPYLTVSTNKDSNCLRKYFLYIITPFILMGFSLSVYFGVSTIPSTNNSIQTPLSGTPTSLPTQSVRPTGDPTMFPTAEPTVEIIFTEIPTIYPSFRKQA